MQLPEYVELTLSKLNKNGYSAYLVGGCVRDSIMGRIPNDYDITTNALPEQILEVFKNEKTLDIGIKHGTVTVVYDKDCVEVTTYRVDGEYDDNRHPKEVSFTDNIEHDLKRRDFTVNSIAYSPNHGYCDPFCGKDDIKSKLIRCVGDPDERFNEDGLRIMRGVRFASTLGFDIEKKTSMSMKKNAELLKNISPERINTEFTKLLCGMNAGKILSEYCDIISVFCPEIIAFCDNKELNSFCAVDKCDEDRLFRMCVFFSMFDDAKQVEEILKRLKYDNKTVKTVTTVCSFLNEEHDNDIVSIKRTISKANFDNTKLIYKTLSALDCDNAEKYKKMLDEVDEIQQTKQCVSVSMLDIDGKIIMDKLGVRGRKIASVLSFLLEMVITEKCENVLSDLLEAAMKYWSEYDE